MYLPVKIIKVVPKMSFPPGPPLHLPGMPPIPPMMPPPYSVPPMGGMIPMTVGMMPGPMMGPMAMTMPAPMPMPHTHKMNKKMNSNNSNYKREYKFQSPLEVHDLVRGPPVTVFVGNITERAPDNLIRQILQRCGIVLNWKRVQGANGKLQAFGFCEYGEPEAALRAIRLLHEWEIGNKKLVVKVDAKTKEKLDEYKAKIMTKSEDEENKDSKEIKKEDGAEKEDKEEGETSDDTLDEETRQRDEIIRAAIVAIIKSHEPELSKPIEMPEAHPLPVPMPSVTEKTKSSQENSPKPRPEFEGRYKKNDLEDMDLEDDKRSLIHREIDKFRDTYKRAEEEKEKDSSSRDRRSSRRRDYESPERFNRESRERDKRYREREDTSRRRRRSRERNNRSPRDSPVMSRETRDRSRERPAERPSSPPREREYTRERETNEKTKDKEWDKEEEEEAYERKKLERKLREKEAIYQERLRNWEARERRRAKEYEKEKLKNEEQKKDELKEARRLKEFLEDYEDDRDDLKYFKGSSLLRRMKEREKEIEEDLLDRQQEKEELDELRKKLAEEGHPDPEAEVERFLLEECRLVETPLKDIVPDSDHEEDHPALVSPPPKMKPIAAKIPRSPPEPPSSPDKKPKQPIPEDDNTQNSFSGFSDLIAHEETKPLGFTSLRIGASPTQTASSPAAIQTNNKDTNSKRKLTIDEVFNANDDEPEQKKKRKLILLDDGQDELGKVPGSVSQMSTEEKRKHIKSLIDKIPTEKNELFAYTLDWSMVDKVLMEKRIRPWINKKIIEYIGEEEPTLVEFICSKIMVGSAAQSILDDVSMVLDDEAEVFVVKMWRLLIYELEAKKLGLVCKNQGGSQENSSQSKS